MTQGKPKTITFLWMQGERDGKGGLAAAYEESMKTLITNLRKDLEAPNMNVVIGRLCDHLDHQQWNGVRAAQVKVAQEDPHGAWVDTDDTNDKEKDGKTWNDLHYTKAGLRPVWSTSGPPSGALDQGRRAGSEGTARVGPVGKISHPSRSLPGGPIRSRGDREGRDSCGPRLLPAEPGQLLNRAPTSWLRVLPRPGRWRRRSPVGWRARGPSGKECRRAARGPEWSGGTRSW